MEKITKAWDVDHDEYTRCMYVMYEGGYEEMIFTYFPNRGIIPFDLIGLTKDEAKQLYYDHFK